MLLVAAVLAVLAVLVTRSRRTRLATPEPVADPVPPPPAPRPYPVQEDNPWTRQLLEALENVVALDDQNKADDPRPGTGSPPPDSDADPEATAAWRPPFASSEPPGPLESWFQPMPRDQDGNAAPSESSADDDDTRPGSTGNSTP
ncbi:hypothetical protein AB0K12_28750 [Nonomuraea sp. NPDC049419]|uniref:hypothetical protein n=1 Tax=Nonomuraea sp. NPDC049419 TaxID=3155772 RepID=UPI003412D1C9